MTESSHCLIPQLIIHNWLSWLVILVQGIGHSSFVDKADTLVIDSFQHVMLSNSNPWSTIYHIPANVSEYIHIILSISSISSMSSMSYSYYINHIISYHINYSYHIHNMDHRYQPLPYRHQQRQPQRRSTTSTHADNWRIVTWARLCLQRVV